MRYFLFIFLFLLGLPNPAKAEVLIEPLIGYNIASKVKIEGEDNYSGSGLGFGGRLGFQKLGFQLGLDYLNSNINLDNGDFGKNVRLNEFAGFVGFEFPVLVRVYAGYIFEANGNSTFDDGTGNKELELHSGSGTKVGVGFTGLPFMCINLEFRSGKFDEYDLGNRTVNEKVNYSSYLLSVSVPFVF